MNLDTRKYWQLGILLLAAFFYIILVVLSQNFPFFWDNVVLVSRSASHFYDAGYSSFILPTKIDAAHPPFYGVYLSLCWHLMGKSLVASHWAVLPFLLLGVYFFLQIAGIFLQKTWLLLATFFYMIEPCLLTQSVIAGIDIAIWAFFLVSVYGILKGASYHNQKKTFAVVPSILLVKAVGLLLLCSLSFRGIVLAFFLTVAEILYYAYFYWKSQCSAKVLLAVISSYVPAGIFVVSWCLYHYHFTGFVLTNTKVANWTENYEIVNLFLFVKNMVIIGWRFLDQGRIFVWLCLLFGAFFWWKKIKTVANIPELLLRLVWVFTFTLVCFSALVSLRTNPIIPRYFLGFYVLGLLLCIYFLQHLDSSLGKKILSMLMGVALLSGHWWIYPQFANAWDASLHCISYFKAKDEINVYLHQQGIPLHEVGTEFPMVVGKKYTHLSSTNDFQLTDIDKIGFDKAAYILYSNVTNYFSDEQMNELQTQFNLLYRVHRGPVCIELYESTRKN